MIRQLQLLSAVSLLALAPLGAQTTSASSSTSSGKANITGVVVDSLNGGYLSGADVMLQGAHASAQTDSLGRFHFDSLSPGDYQVGVFHPLLDALGVAIATRQFHLGRDSSSFVLLAVPSAATVISGRCPVTPGAPNVAVIGQVNDPETLTAVNGAEVSLAWSEIEISKEVGVRQTPHLVRDTTDDRGAFKFCGLPISLSATLQAKRGNAATAEIPIEVGDQPVALFARNLLLAAADSSVKTGSASASGVVRLEGGAPSAGTRVELIGTDIVALTDAKGEFSIHNLPSGSRVLLARHIGFAAQTATVDLSSHEQSRVNITLPKYIAVMDPVLVTARRNSALDKVGFGRRQKSAFGYFMGPDRLAKMHAIYVSDVLRMVPGLRVVSTPQGDVVRSTRDPRGSCVDYFVDDMQFTELSPGDINSFVNAGEVVAVEVYQSGTAPPQYTRNMGACTTILLWTKFKIRS